MKTTGLFIAMTAIFAFATSAYTSSEHEGHGSTISWVGKKVTGQHAGTLEFQSVDMKFDEAGTLLSASFVVDMNSLACTDLEGDMAAKLVGHLRSDDFFGVDAHPTAEFKSVAIKSKDNGQYEIKGDLTIKGVTESIDFDAEVVNKGGVKHAAAKLVVNRTKYGIKYGSGSFFDNLGDNMIYDDFELDIHIQTK